MTARTPTGVPSVPRLSGLPAGLVRSAAFYRYGDKGWRGPVLLLVSILDVLVYAIVLTAVIETVFGLGGLNRFVPSLIGLISIRWSLSCAIQASRVASLVKLFAPYHQRPVLATLIVALGPGTLVFAISAVVLSLLLAATARDPASLLHMFGWGLFAACIQLLWNAVLALAVIHARLRHVLLSEVPILFVFLFILIVSPVAYQFTDIPAAASRLLTSLNPAAHLIAAYQNAFWYVRDVSLEVLPVSALLACLLLAGFGHWARGLAARDSEQADEARRCFTWNGISWTPVSEAPHGGRARVFSRWHNETPWVSGANFLSLLGLSPDLKRATGAFFGRISGSFDVERVMQSPLPIVSDRNRDRLCLVAAVMACRSGESAGANVVALRAVEREDVVLDGLLDHMDEGEVARLTDCLRVFDIGEVTIVTYRNRVSDTLMRLAMTSRADDSRTR